jgi:hypothetical protein
MRLSTRLPGRELVPLLLAFVLGLIVAVAGAAAGPDELASDRPPAIAQLLDDEAAPLLGRPVIDPREHELDGVDPLPEAERAIQQELEMGPRPSFPLRMSARLNEDGGPLPDGLIWRIFRAEPGRDGAFELIDESHSATPSFLLPADEYIVHVAYGLANSAKRVSLSAGPVEEEIMLEAGGLRVFGVDAGGEAIAERLLAISVYSSEEEEYGQRRQLIERAAPGRVIRLNPGTYHVVSRYGDANAVIRADIQVKPGELTDARIQHRAAAITFKLVNEAGGEALADTAWTVLTPEGETVKESFGAFPTHILVEGSYGLVAHHDGRVFNRAFEVMADRDREVEVLAR